MKMCGDVEIWIPKKMKRENSKELILLTGGSVARIGKKGVQNGHD